MVAYKQNITRDIEVKSNLTIARGEWGGGQFREGITGTTIKDTWTKSRGRVEVGEGVGFSWHGMEGWGENADNCNRITIKIKKILFFSVLYEIY